MSRKSILFIAGFLLCLNIFAWQEVFALNLPRYLRVDFLSVGQGDSAFLQTPGGHQILIDGGPDSTVLAKLAKLMPFWDKSIDVVILSHPEKDHMAGILDILQRYSVGHFIWNGIIKNNAENKQLAVLLQQASSSKSILAALSGNVATKIVTVGAGKKIKAGNVLIDILYPLKNNGGENIQNTNDTSIVNKVTYGKSSFLFTGDISSIVEKEIVDSGKDVSSEVLKVGHHGSKYSTSDLFLEIVKPKMAVVEVGKNNYGHPTPEVLNRLENFGIKIFITQRDGDIRFISDGKTIQKL